MTLQIEERRPSLIGHDASRVDLKMDFTEEEKKNPGILETSSRTVADAINHGYILVGAESFNLIDYVIATFTGLSTDEFKRTRFQLINIWNEQGCLTGDQWIYTPKGAVKVSEVYEGQPTLGGFVKGLHRFEDDVYEVEVNSMVIKANGEHPFWAMKERPSDRNARPRHRRWMKLSEMFEINQSKKNPKKHPGLFVCLTRPSAWRIEERSVGLDFAKLLGYLMSDGYFAERQSASFANTRESILSDVAEIGARVGAEMGFKVNARATQSATALYLVGRHGSRQSLLLDRLREMGLMNRDTLGPIQNFPEAELAAFIQGYFNGDGTLTIPKVAGMVKAPQVRVSFYVGIHERQARELQFILWRLGVNSHIRYRLRAPKGSKEIPPGYQGCWEIEVGETRSVKKLIAFLDDRKYPERFAKAREILALKSEGSAHFEDEEGVWLPVTSIRKAGRDFVYGWQAVPDSEIICANGLKTHNSMKTNLAVQLIAEAAGCFEKGISDEEWRRRWTWVREMCIVSRQDLIRVGRRIQAGDEARFPVLLLDDVNSILGRQLAWEDRDLYRLAFETWGMIRRVVGCIITTEPNIGVIQDVLCEMMTFEVIVYPGSKGNPSMPSYTAERMCNRIHPYYRDKGDMTKIIVEEDVMFDPLSVPSGWWATYQPETNKEGRAKFGKMLDRMEEIETELLEGGKGAKEERKVAEKVARNMGNTRDIEKILRDSGLKGDGTKMARAIKAVKDYATERVESKAKPIE